MKLMWIAAALLTAHGAMAQPQRPNEVVYQSAEWRVVRSVREHGNVVACTAFLKGHPAMQLSKDMMIFKVPKQARVGSVAIAFDREVLRGPRELTQAEQDAGAIVLAGGDFERLTRARVLRLVVHGGEGTRNLRLDLTGIVGALEVVNACPAK